MLRSIVYVLLALTSVRAQIPSLGFCPEYVPMANFNMERFVGVWYEAERYFQLSEVVSRCVMANYTKRSDGKYHVSNEVTNRFTGIKRVLEGEIRPAASKAEEGKLHVKYTTVPLTPETKYSVLETDYDTYAVLWSCSGLGPVHTQNAWIMTRKRLPPGEVLQKAYGVLDKYKISKTFFVKTDQEDCAFLDTFIPVTAEKVPSEDREKSVELRESVMPDTPNIIVDTKKADSVLEEKIEKLVIEKKEKLSAKKKPEITEENIQGKSNIEIPPAEAPVADEPITSESEKLKPAPVPELILKSAENMKKDKFKEEEKTELTKPLEETANKKPEKMEKEIGSNR